MTKFALQLRFGSLQNIQFILISLPHSKVLCSLMLNTPTSLRQLILQELNPIQPILITRFDGLSFRLCMRQLLSQFVFYQPMLLIEIGRSLLDRVYPIPTLLPITIDVCFQLVNLLL